MDAIHNRQAIGFSRFHRVGLWVALGFWVMGCASFTPPAAPEMPFTARAQTQGDFDIQVKAAVLTAEESEAVFGVDLAGRWIQPVWIEVTNTSDRLFWFLSPGIDADYYAPHEVAYIYQSWYSNKASRRMSDYFDKMAFKNPVHPGETKSGFVFVHYEQDLREVSIELVGRNRYKAFRIVSTATELKGRNLYQAEGLFSENEILHVDETDLKNHLERLPCCTTSRDGTVGGDPLNMILIGSPQNLGRALIRRGWHQAEQTYWGSVWKTINSFLFGEEYLYSPVSPLYAMGRKQDYAAQKAHGAVNRRNHFRLWSTPLRFEGRDVWVGQISRDIGVRLTTRTSNFVTHKIDPDIDEARAALTNDLILSNHVEKIGYVVGVGECTREVPCENLTGDPYYTDGLRVVLMLGDGQTPITDLQFFPWQHPKGDRQIF